MTLKVTGNGKTGTQKQAEFRKRRAASGLVRCEVWVDPEDRELLKTYAAWLRSRSTDKH